MKKKIMKIMLFITSLLLILFAVITLQMLSRVRSILLAHSEKSGSQVEEYSDKAMSGQIRGRLRTTTMGCAYVVDETLKNFAGTVEMIAYAASDIYTNPDKYGRTMVRTPEKADIGKSMEQFVYAEDVDPRDPAILDELSMIGNLQGNLMAMYGEYEELGAASIGTESGIMLLAGEVLPERWNKDGTYGNLDARLRPWYRGAKLARKVHYSAVTPDYDTGRLAIMCGAPIYRGDEFVGVAGAGIYLEGIESLMMNARISEEGDSCIIDSKGRIIFTSQDEGELKKETIIGEGYSTNKEFVELVKKAIAGQSGLELLEIDGERSYVAYYPIETVGWSLFSIIPEETVLAPKADLIESLTESRNSEIAETQTVIGSALFTIFGMIIIMGIISFIAANVFSKHLVQPITLLTDKVRKLEGDQLDFEWNVDTGDEVQTLANSFGSMTGRMKRYIEDIRTATAEKERLGAELSLATKIQASMLPHEFPPFPDRKEFDIYAAMEPAREVGGDFYDFFLIDEDHLGLLIADVSGKGVPAALFMMAAKIILQSCAMLGKSAAEVLNKTNEALTSNNQTGMFVTVWLGILEISSGKLTCANAGHEYPAIKRADGRFELFKDKHGFVIGGMEGTRYKEYTLDMKRGDKLFVYTDGVPEATDARDNMYGTERMIKALNINPDASPKDILQNVRFDVGDFVQDAEQFDDLTMMCIEFK